MLSNIFINDSNFIELHTNPRRIHHNESSVSIADQSCSISIAGCRLQSRDARTRPRVPPLPATRSTNNAQRVSATFSDWLRKKHAPAILWCRSRILKASSPPDRFPISQRATLVVAQFEVAAPPQECMAQAQAGPSIIGGPEGPLTHLSDCT